MEANSVRTQPGIIPAPIQVNSWVVLVVLLMGFFMILLDLTIVNVAIPAIEHGLNTSYDRILWVLNGYTLVYAVLLITGARLGDMFGPKRLFIIGLVIFTVASGACATATSDTELIVFRVIQGVGGALLTPQSLTIITSIFPPEQRGVAFGLWGALAGVASTVGPILGGWLVTDFAWQAIFLINIPIGIITVVLVYLLMPEVRSDYKHDLDAPGVILVSIGLFLGIFALIEGQHYAWGRITSFASFSIGPTRWSALSIYSLLVYSAIVLAIFVVVETRAREPILPLSLLRIRNFSVGSGVYTLLGFAIFPFFTPFTIFMQSVLGWSAIHAGLTTLPLSAALIVASPVSGSIANRGYGKQVLIFGLLTAAAGFAFVTLVLGLNNTSWTYVLPLIVVGIGMGCSFAPLTTLVMHDVPPAEAGGASGFLNTVQQVGGALGLAVVGAIQSNQVAAAFSSRAAAYAPQIPAAFRAHFLAGWQAAAHAGLKFGSGQTSNALPKGIPHAVAQQLAMVNHEVFANAFLDGTRPALMIPVIGVLAGAVAAFGLTGRQAPAEAGVTSEAAAPVTG